MTHLIVAELVFWECMKRELLEHKCIGDNVYSAADKIMESSPSSEDYEKEAVIESLTRWFLGFKDVHIALGWLAEPEES